MTATDALAVEAPSSSTRTTSGRDEKHLSSSSTSTTASHSTTRVIARSNPDDVVEALSRAHNCSSVCRACSHARRTIRPATTLGAVAPLIRSAGGLRLARHARRKGWAFPRFSGDGVVQFAVEEALIARLERSEHEQTAAAAAITEAHAAAREALSELDGDW